MPQLDYFSYTTLTLSTFLVFFMLLFLIHSKFLPQIAESLKLRYKIIKKDNQKEFQQIYESIMINSIKIISLRPTQISIIEKLKHDKY